MMSRAGFTVLIMTLLASTSFATGTPRAEGSPKAASPAIQSTHAGLAIDNRCNIYTAETETGHIYCTAPGQPPILLAKVPDTPTTLAVDTLRNVFVGTQSGVIYLVSLDGNVVPTCTIGQTPMGLGVDRDGALVIATSTGRIMRVKRSDLRAN